MSLHQLVGSVLMLGFRGDSLDDPETREDISQLKAIHCGGVILFDHDIKANGSRNIQSPEQLAKLIADLRNELGSDLIIGIDQEGGQVARLEEHNGFRPTISAKDFAQLETIDQLQNAKQQAKQISTLLRALIWQSIQIHRSSRTKKDRLGAPSSKSLIVRTRSLMLTTTRGSRVVSNTILDMGLR